jgi:phosphate transport system substrate-binding protein
MLATSTVAAFLLLQGGNLPSSARAPEAADFRIGGCYGAEPLVRAWEARYAQTKGVRLAYVPASNREALQELKAGKLDLALVEGCLDDTQLQEMKGKGDVVQVAIYLRGVGVTYHLSDTEPRLRLDGPILADVFLGKITTWNDRRIKRLNPSVELPARRIVVYHRLDATSTTVLFTEYLSRVSKEWKDKIGSGYRVDWPVGEAPLQSQIYSRLRTTPGAIGYVELLYAVKTGMPLALLKNPDGKFVQPSMQTLQAASVGALKNADHRWLSGLANAPGIESYPICGVGCALLGAERGPARTSAAQFLNWAIHDGQKCVADVGYARLPDEVVKKEEGKLRRELAK